MRLKTLFAPIAAALALSACSSDEPVAENPDISQGGSRYLAVNIVSTPSASGTRAPEDANNYEEGDDKENTVNKVRFYFFNENGTAANVRHDNAANYYDWTSPTTDGDNMPNVEKILTATIVISTPEGDQLPTKMVAVINPDTEALGTESLSISELRNRKKDYVAAAAGANGAFVMTNSVYADGTHVMAWSNVARENLCNSGDDAKANPVNIYVERNVAKIRLKFKESYGTPQADGSVLIPLKDQKGNEITVGNGEKVYVKVTGWNVTADAKEGYLSKHIDTWASDLFGSEPWNYAPYFRSYWAVNHFAATDQNWENNLSWHPYNAIGTKKFDGTLANSLYINENAPHLIYNDIRSGSSFNADHFTKAIIAGTLCDENGQPIEVSIFMGMRYAGEDALKDVLLNQLQQNGMYYKVTKSAETVSYSSLKKEDVKFVTAKVAVGAGQSEASTGRYVVYLQVADANAQFSMTDAKDQDQTKWKTATTVNGELANRFTNLQIHKGGSTYYYFPIQHLGAANKFGQYGVVRNHIYDCTINSIVGLGTPVYDPTETIYPEKPENEETYIAAAIKILSWRVVPNNVNLKW